MELTKYDFERDYSSTFTGRDAELKWLDERLFRGNSQFNPVIISGMGGIGKTSLVKHWLSSRRISNTPIWLDLSLESDNKKSLDNLINYLSRVNEEKFPYGEHLIVVIDGSDIWTEEQHSQASQRIFNYKMIKSLIFIKRESIKIDRSQQLVLNPLSEESASDMIKKLVPDNIGENGLIELVAASQGYPLAIALLAQLLKDGNSSSIAALLKKPLYELSNNILVPKTEIITSVSPIILSANQNIVISLKKQPDDLFRLQPREFEKLLAELLRDMGWEVELTKQTRDGGADILAYLNTDVGRLLCLVEAKHYRQDRKIGVDLVRTLYGTLCDAQANSAMLVTSSSFTADAKEFQQKHQYQLNLREYADIVTWIAKYGIKTNNNA